jgi:hypothetical protein
VVLICVLVIRIFFIILEEKGAPDTRWVGKYVVENNKEKKGAYYEHVFWYGENPMKLTACLRNSVSSTPVMKKQISQA